MSRLATVWVLLSLVVPAAAAQWALISQDFEPTDFAILDGRIVVSGASTISPAASQEIHVSSDGGQTWSLVSAAEGRNVVATPDGFVLSRGGNAHFVGSPDAQTWSDADWGALEPAITTTFFYDSSADRLYAGTQNYTLLVSSDRGRTWQTLPLVSSDNEITFVHARGSAILAGYNGTGGALHLSTDGGSTWTDLNQGRPTGGFLAENGDIYLTKNVNIGVVTPSNALWRSRDGGATFEQLFAAPNAGFQGRQSPMRQSAAIYVEGTNLMFNANDRFYISEDDGVTWTDASDGIIPDDTNGSSAMAFHVDGGRAYILLQNRESGNGLHTGYGLYARPVTELGFATDTSTEKSSEQPAGFELVGAYPNPFNPSTTVSYTIAQPGRVRLTVVDALGREQAVLTDARHASGQFEATWDASSMPSGTYLIRLEREGFTSSKLVALVK